MSEPVTSSPIRLVVGLGNPGPEYVHTRHNIGFRVVDELARRWGARFARRRMAHVAESVRGRPILMKPQTYMNLSGEAIAALRRSLGLQPNQILVVYDELDLPFGRIRLRQRGSAGGHRGIASVIQSLGTQEVPRLRIGIGRPPDDAVDHVLAPFTPDEEAVLPDVVARAADAVEYAIAEGMEAAMNRFNAM